MNQPPISSSSSMYPNKKDHMRTPEKISFLQKRKGVFTSEEPSNTMILYFPASRTWKKLKFCYLSHLSVRHLVLLVQDTSFVTWPIIDHGIKTVPSHAMTDLINIYGLDQTYEFSVSLSSPLSLFLPHHLRSC